MPYETQSIMLDKAKGLLSRLRDAIYVPLSPLTVNAWVTPEPVAYNERMSGTAITDLKPGDRWGQLWDCAWFNFRGKVDASAAGQKVVLLIDINGELCLVDSEGTPHQGLTTVNSEFDFALGLPGKRVVPVSTQAQGGEEIDLWADAGCNDLFGIYRGGTLKEATLAICKEEYRALYYDIEVLAELAEHLPESTARKDRVIRALYEAALMLAELSDENVSRARARLAIELAQKGGDPQLTVHAIGHAHIDLAWLWPLRETIRKGARTFATALRNMEKYPDYVFGASQPQLYLWIKQYYPGLYEQIKARVAEGRWELQGAMWVEPDTNISGGEALARQILYGKRFFEQEFGQEMKSLWLPDVFGYSGSLPQLLKKAGVDYMMTQKLSWSVYTKHPHHSFFWEGIDGTRVLTHLPPEDTYNSPAAPRSLTKIESSYLDRAVSEHALMLFGIGDGGGGPGEEHLERLMREKNLLGLPPVVQESSHAFFQKLEQEADRFETFRGELYLEKHQGTLTTQARSKQFNRQMEKALRELEFAASWAYVSGGYAYPTEELAVIWQEVLLYQFHDILPGSSITRVYTESLERYAILLPRVQELTADAYAHVAKAAGLAEGTRVLFNSLPWEREQGVEQDGAHHSITLPAMGYRVVDTAVASAPAEQAGQAAAVLRATEHELENEALHVRFHADGSLASVYDKIAGREVLAPQARGNVLAVYHDNGDAWDFPRDYREMPAGAFTLTAASAAVVGAQAILTHDYSYGDSTLKQRIILAAGEDTLRFETEADWRENAKMLRASFPLSVQAEVAQCDIQFGYLKRATTRNTREEFARDEICAHHYIDLSQPDYGVSLLNDCKYGFSAATNSLDIHLLRAPHYPDPTADRAKHTFVYALYPHQGDAVQALTYRKGYELNVSPVEVTLPAAETSPITAAGLTAASGEQRMEQMTFAELDHAQVMIEAIKKAEDSPHLIIRLYETAGMTTRTQLSLGIKCLSAEETDLMEQPLQPLDMVKVDGKDTVELTFTPFEIKTVRIMPVGV